MRRFPPYPRSPHRSGQARIVISGKTYYLGVHGSDKSWAEYNRLLGEWRAGKLESGATMPVGPVRTVAGLIAHYLAHLKSRAERRGDRRELDNHADALMPLERLLGHMPPTDLRPKALHAALRTAATGEWLTVEEKEKRKKGGRKCVWSLDYANRCLSRWKGMVKWAESEELVPGGTLAQIQATRGLDDEEASRCADVVPVSEEVLGKALPHLNPVVRALVETLLWTAARPGEICRLTPGDIDRSGEVEIARNYRVRLGAGVWAWQPHKHKTAWRGHRRILLFGPTAQRILTPFLEGRPADKPLFCPQEASNRPPGGNRPPRLHYTRHSLGQAIERACARADVEAFAPYQLRHLAAVRLCSEFSPEVAQCILGHSDLKTTEIYARLGRAARALEDAG